VTAVVTRPEGPAPSPAPGPSSRTAAPGPKARWVRRAWPVPAVLAIVAAAAMVPSWGRSGPGRGEAFVTLDGTARVERVDGSAVVLEGGANAGGTRAAKTTLHQGDTFDLVTGQADLRLSGSVRMDALAGASLVMGARPELRQGDLLVSAQEPTEVTAAGTRVRFDGTDEAPVAGRLSRTAGLSVGLYRGAARVDSAGTARALRALRRVDVPALGEITGVQPIRFRADDPWDRRYLGDAIALDRRLAQLLPGFQRSALHHGGGAQGLAAMLGRVDGMPSARSLTRLVDPDRPLQDVLLGATIASLADGGSYAHRWSEALRFRDAGATWGLVALDRRVSPGAVLDALQRVVDATPLDFGSAGRANGAGAGHGTSSTADGAGGGTDGGGATAGPAGSSGPGTTTGTGSDGNGDGGSGNGGGGGGGGGTVTVPTTPTLPPVTVPTTPTLPPITTTTNPVGGIVDGVSHTVTTLVQGVGDTVGKVVKPPPDDGPDCLLGVLCS